MIMLSAPIERTAAELAAINNMPVESWLSELVEQAYEDYQDLQAIRQYEADKANGTLELISLEEFNKHMEELNALEN